MTLLLLLSGLMAGGELADGLDDAFVLESPSSGRFLAEQ